MSADDDTSTRLRELLGARLADKLLNETQQSVSAQYRRLIHETQSAANIRASLLDDELAEAKFAHVRDEAKQLLLACYADSILCKYITLTCALNLRAGRSMAEYLVHTASHYDSLEKLTRIVEAAGLLDKLGAEPEQTLKHDHDLN